MSFVSKVTAKLLKDEGFPQPKTWAPGQVWYERNRNEIGSRHFIWTDCIPGCDDDDRYFAPTATDLLPHNWMLVRHGSQWECIEENEVDNFFANGFAPQNLFTDDNPHEAAAKAWRYVRKTAIPIPQQGDEPF